MKYEWKKQDKALYGAKQTPALIAVPQQHYIMIDGHGDPNGPDFSGRVSALYAVAYAIKMGYKADARISGNEIEDYTVYPLEGVWSQPGGGALAKQALAYTIMIRQPEFISEARVAAALEQVKTKKPDSLYEEIRFGAMEDGLCVEMLHVGPYDNEPASFARMERFAAENGLARRCASHREIYLSNPERVAPEKRKTILRYAVAGGENE